MDKIDTAILIPCFNNPIGLTETLHSLENIQTAFDVIVVDDGSSPPLEIRGYIGSHTVHAIRLEKNQGITKALNVGLEHILGLDYQYIARIDAGDLCIEGRLEKQTAFLEANPSYALVGSHARFCDSSKKILFTVKPPSDESRLRRVMHLNNVILHPTVMMRTDALRTVGIYSEAYPAAEDYEMFLRLMKHYRVSVLPEVLTECEFNPRGISLTKKRVQVLSRLRLQSKYFIWSYLESYIGVARSLGVLVATPFIEIQRRASERSM